MYCCCHGNSPIAVLLESFSLFYNEDDSCLHHGVIKDFVLVWSKFDQKASVSDLTTAVMTTTYFSSREEFLGQE